MNEHRVIESVLNSLEKAIKKLDAGENVRPDFFLEVVHFIQEYSDNCHHSKEETIFFEAMLNEGYSKEEEPLKSMFTEHNMESHFTRGIKMAAEDVKSGDRSRIKILSANSRNYVTLLKLHIQREDSEIYPKAKQDLSDEAIDKIEVAFLEKLTEENDNGIHTKFTALAEKLKLEIAG